MASPRRPLRIFPFDPMVDRFGRSVIADIPYEKLEPGPSGRLVQVIDYDAVRDCFYEPVDLDAADVLLNQGLDLSEADPRFHQQMVYAVIMRVLEAFERGLGRPFRWRRNERLRVFPHAFEGQNAFFEEDLFALVFGYFEADAEDPGPNLPSQIVFTCLSHDIVAHETTHAVVKRLRPHYSNPTNRDVLAFHEGFSDVVAILQHFTYPAVVADHLGRARTDLHQTESLLSLAGQFGFASGTGRALRTALSRPDKTAYESTEEEHDLGSLFVAAIIDGFMRTYNEEIADLVRIATAGSGVLQPGALHPDLVARVARTAARTAERVFNICIGAFDYLPPVDVTFGDYLRALVTADFDVFPEDEVHLRANLIEGFRARGIYPRGVVSLTDRSLRIEPVDPADFKPIPQVQKRLVERTLDYKSMRMAQTTSGPAAAAPVETDTERSESAEWARQLHAWASKHRGPLGLDPDALIQVDGFFTRQRVNSDGHVGSEASVRFVQRRPDLADDLGGVIPMGGVTVVADGEGEVRYVVGKPLPVEKSPELDALQGFVAGAEHRLRSVAWSGDPKRAVAERLNLRRLDAPH